MAGATLPEGSLMQRTGIEHARFTPKPRHIGLIVIQCVLLAALFTGAGLVLASAIVSWADLS